MTHLPQFRKVDLQRLRIVLEAEVGHGVEDVLAANRLALLDLALLRRLRRDEADELGDALLHALLGLLRDLRRPRHRRLHYPRHVRYLQRARDTG